MFKFSLYVQSKILRKYAFIKRSFLIKKFRRFSDCHPNVIIEPEQSVFIEKLLPSEPPEGINYSFCASGYIEKKTSYPCIIFTPIHSYNNYCHWLFSELPLLFLGFEHDCNRLVINDDLLNAKLKFQIRWLAFLKGLYPDKLTIKLSEYKCKSNYTLPINHDSSLRNDKIGKAKYKNYHVGRATPYLIQRLNYYQDYFLKEKLHIPKLYINRKTRRLKNEENIQAFLSHLGFSIISLEDYSVDQQIEIFENAEIVIGCHGAGLANIIFCSEKTKIIEIVDQDFVYPSYLDGKIIPGIKATRTYFHMVAKMKGLNYSVIESTNYYLPSNKLKEKISQLCKMKPSPNIQAIKKNQFFQEKANCK